MYCTADFKLTDKIDHRRQCSTLTDVSDPSDLLISTLYKTHNDNNKEKPLLVLLQALGRAHALQRLAGVRSLLLQTVNSPQ